jgi:thioredoxin 1
MLVLAIGMIVYRLFGKLFRPKEVIIEGSRVIPVNILGEIKQTINDNKLVVLDFYANWCPGCVYAAPDFARLSKLYPNVVFLKVNTDEAREAASHYGIEALPTFKVFSTKKEIGSLVGFDKKALIATLESAGAISSQE